MPNSETAVEEYKEYIHRSLEAANERLTADITRLYSKPFSLLRDHEIRVRRARHVVETAELEAERIQILMQEAALKMLHPIVGMNAL